MCFILIAHRVRPDLPVLVAANRDEYYERPARAAGWWDRSPAILAGRDDRAGGTWFGVREDGRFAAVTNLRLPGSRAAATRSRGELALAAIDHPGPLGEFGREIERSGGSYGPFNLVFGDHRELYYYSNGRERHEALAPGIYALANGFLDAPWPKAVEGRQRFAALLRDTEPDVDALFDLLGDRRVHDDGLPDTGLPPERRTRPVGDVHRGPRLRHALFNGLPAVRRRPSGFRGAQPCRRLHGTGGRRFLVPCRLRAGVETRNGIAVMRRLLDTRRDVSARLQPAEDVRRDQLYRYSARAQRACACRCWWHG
ncbi:MAG: NRDE family protein [Gammaproteobacteria bacterium]|nr:NRDE family protein [Gammaproteobacteria bacterium]